MRFNRPTTEGRHKTVNLAGGSAFVQEQKSELVTILLTSFLNDSYYRTVGDTMERVKELVREDPLFAAKAAIHARHTFGMRSITHMVAGEIGLNVKGARWTRHFFRDIIRRPDDILEILSYVKKPVPNAMKKGFAEALRKFDAYQLGKYKREGAAMSLVDAVNLVRPVPTPQLDQLMKGTLPLPQTWEVLLTQAGDDPLKKEKVWKDLLVEDKLPYFALLRNLWNISQQAPAYLDTALERLQEPARIRRSLVLPFRFLIAIKEMQNKPANTNKIIAALSEALDLSVANIPHLPGNTLVIVDRSGSMSSAVTLNKSFSCAELGCLFGFAVAKENPKADVMIFGSTAAMLSYNSRDSLASLTMWGANEINPGNGYFIRGGGILTDRYDVGHSTNLGSAIQLAQLQAEKHGKVYNRMIVFSDMQSWHGLRASTALSYYEKVTGTKPIIHCFDLTGYGSLQFPEDRVIQLGGFSEKAFDLIVALEEGGPTLVKQIEAINIGES